MGLLKARCAVVVVAVAVAVIAVAGCGRGGTSTRTGTSTSTSTSTSTGTSTSTSTGAGTGTGRGAGTGEGTSERWGEAEGLKYLELVQGGARLEDRLPMLVMLHGRGDRPRRDYLPELGLELRLVMPQAPTPLLDGFSWFDYRATDQRPEALAAGIAAASDRLATAIARLARRLPTRGRVIVSGFSQGGMLSYALALRNPALFERSLPLSGLLPPSLWPERPEPGVRYPPIRACHGTADTLVPFEPARALISALQARGFDAELTEFPGVRHTISPAMLERLQTELGRSVAELSKLP
jgi:phospholipase/carboxylesterase